MKRSRQRLEGHGTMLEGRGAMLDACGDFMLLRKKQTLRRNPTESLRQRVLELGKKAQ